MADKEEEDGAFGSSTNTSSQKQHGLFGATGIQLTEEETCSIVTTKFLRHLNDTQATTIITLNSYQNQYYDKRQECEVLKKEKEIIEKELKIKKETENLQKVMITVGGIMLGALKFLEGQPWYFMLLIAAISTVLIVGGMFPALRIGSSK